MSDKNNILSTLKELIDVQGKWEIRKILKCIDDNEFKILENFTPNDLKGISAVRNYIAHDYV
jgi:hypothetical protein